MTTTPTHAAQDTANAREAANPLPPVSPAETAAALDTGANDGGAQDPVNNGTQPVPAATPAPPAPEGAEPIKPVVRSRFDDKRAEITARFRSSRTAEVADAQDDVTAFAREGGMPEDFRHATGEEPQSELTPEPEPAPDTAAAPAPVLQPAPGPEQKFKLTVNGRPVELTAEQVVAEAQKALAAGDILGDAKSLRAEMGRILDETRTAAAHPAAPVRHQDGSPVQPEPPPAPEDVRNQDDLQALVEKIQFGDSKEAATLLRDTIGKAVVQATAPVVEARLIEGRLRDEGARTKQVLQDFKDQNPDLASDPYAHAVMERAMLDMQVEDLGKIGVDPATLRTDGLPATPTDIANAHRWFRTEQGFSSLRSPETMLVQAKDKVLAWKGVKPEPAADPVLLPQGKPRVEISVNRADRRQAVQPQPQRTAAPQQRQPAQQPAQPRDRSDVVSAMQKRSAIQRGRAPLSV